MPVFTSVLVFLMGWLTCLPEAVADERAVITQALETELQRSVDGLRLEGFEAPYFISFRLVDEATDSAAFETAPALCTTRKSVQIHTGCRPTSLRGKPTEPEPEASPTT